MKKFHFQLGCLGVESNENGIHMSFVRWVVIMERWKQNLLRKACSPISSSIHSAGNFYKEGGNPKDMLFLWCSKDKDLTMISTSSGIIVETQIIWFKSKIASFGKGWMTAWLKIITTLTIWLGLGIEPWVLLFVLFLTVPVT